MTADDLEAGKTSAAISMSTATASPIAPIPARIRPRAPSSPAARRRTASALYRRRPGLCREHGAAAEEVRHAPRTWCRSRCARQRRKPTRLGAIYFGSTSPAMDEALDILEAERPSRSTRCGCAGSRSATRSTTSSPRTTRCSWSSRTATRQLRTLLINELEIDPAQAGHDPALRRHADHRALHRRRRSPRSSASSRSFRCDKAAS